MGGKLLLLLIMLVSASDGAYSAETSPNFPSDVAKFIEDRVPCDHFRGEPRDFDESYKHQFGERALKEEAERAAFLEEMTEKACSNMDNRLRALNKKYAGNKLVVDKLSEYEYLEIGSGYVFIHKDFPNAELIQSKLTAKGFMYVSVMEGKDWRGIDWSSPLPSKLIISIGSEVDVFAAQLAIETLLEYGPKDIGFVVLPKNDGALSLSMLAGRNLIGNNHVYRGNDIQKLLSPNLTRGDFDKFAKQSQPDPSAPCSKEMAACNGKELGCVRLRFAFEAASTCDDKCQLALFEKLQTATIPFHSIVSGRASVPFNCVGYRKDANGTEEGAKCIARLLGLEYRADGCNEDGWPYAAKIFIKDHQ